jgi:tRNA modification GTPase
VAYDAHDTIAAIGSAAGGAARGIVRLSGPATLDCLAACFAAEEHGASRAVNQPHRVAGSMHVTGDANQQPLVVLGHLFLWPGVRSYTREPSAEFHCCGSPPLLAAVLDELCRCGARPADPGEFTLRAFLAGRIDLTQAEGVLGVVDARERDDLEGALDQLAGGLSRPLHELRERLLGLLAELEAGLDFAEEPIEFIGRQELRGRVEEGRRVVAATLAQLRGREREAELPRVVLGGAPNVGKSSLFNALVERFGDAGAVRSLVSSMPGATRDYVAAPIDVDGMACELIDAAGDAPDAFDGIQQAAQRAAATQQRRADLRLRCAEAGGSLPSERAGELVIATKSDLAASQVIDGAIRCSSVTGAGLDELAVAIRQRIAASRGDRRGVAAATAARCSGSLHEADRALAAALALTHGGGEELLAAEIRAALQAIGVVVGAVCADDVLDRVFSQFCLGK